jgi:septal ring factor EnvC (AmiA/AmiB activator)
MKIAFFAMALLYPAIVLAQEPAAKLLTVRETLKAEEARKAEAAAAADAAERALTELQQQSVTLAATVQALETDLARLGAETERLNAARTAQEAALAAAATAQEEVLTSLVQLSRKPPPAVLLRSGGAAEAARAAAVMDAVLSDAAAKSAALRQQVQQLQTLQQQSAAVQAEQQERLESLAEERAALAEALAQKRELLASATAAEDAAAARIRALATEARSLEELMGKLQKVAEAPAPPPSRRKQDMMAQDSDATTPDGRVMAAEAVPAVHRNSAVPMVTPRRGGLNRPVAGRILARFGQAGRFSNRNRGITWRTAPQAVVVAPWGGEVAYAGPFRGYGNIVILKHRGSYYSVVAGLSRIGVQPGQRLTSGEPLGQMSKAASTLDLYLEFRRNDTPIDPMPWLMQARSG